MAKSIMIQGTMSGAGKSLLTAAFCRIFHQDGYKVAPFKSQNMALNSFVTEEGLEMGRAQVLQAEAAGVKPSVLMNPILLKPTSDVGSQVIVNGEVLSTMRAKDYFRYKKNLIPVIQEAYDKLSAQNDIIVLEGAGSPAEINLKQDDIVNMGMAKLAHAPVLLVGDIDRGGVFASLYGTVALLDEDEKRRVKGLIINKFRGDASILAPGYPMLEALTQIPVLGAVPMMALDLEDEDSVAQRLTSRRPAELLHLAVVRLPRISNFTDFHALEQVDGVSVSYLTKPDNRRPDAIFLPGTKNTLADLRWLRASGMESWLLKWAAQGVPVIGICGGYQMLGERLCDPDGVEDGGELRGIGLLPQQTVFRAQKTRTQTTAVVLPQEGFFAPLSGQTVRGYQIHQGVTTACGAPLWANETQTDGAVLGRVMGTYLHGLFDEDDFRQAFLQLLLAEKGLPPEALGALDAAAEKERQLDLLAQTVREHLPMEQIYDILQKGCDV